MAQGGLHWGLVGCECYLGSPVVQPAPRLVFWPSPFFHSRFGRALALHRSIMGVPENEEAFPGSLRALQRGGLFQGACHGPHLGMKHVSAAVCGGGRFTELPLRSL